jgi:trk system potassium uptake protein TrkA
MNVIIAGVGEVGAHSADVLSKNGHKVTAIDLSHEKLQHVADSLDIRTLVGNCTHFETLREAGSERCDLMIAATRVDEINLLSASMAKATGAKRTIVRVHHTANFSLRNTPYARQLGIDELICPEYLTSAEIARTLRNPGSLALEEFAHGQLMMQRIPVAEEAPVAGKKLAEVTFPRNTRVATIDRGGTISVAHAGTQIETGDFVTVIGKPEAFEPLLKLFGREKEGRIHVAVMGETTTAVWLCRALKSRLFSVRLFVDRRERGEELAEKLEHVTVLTADPTDPTTIEDEQLARMECFVGVTDDDERNVLACAQAKRLGIPTVIAVLERAKYLHLLPHVGIDHAFSPREGAVRAILHFVDTGPVRSVAQFAGGAAAVYEIRPSRRSKVLGKELRNVQLPPHTMVAAVRRGDEVYVPGAEDQIRAEDTVLVIGPPDIQGPLTKLFVPK